MNYCDDKERRREETAMETPDVPFAIDGAHGQVLIAGRPVSLRATEFRILQLLAGAPNRVFARTEILEGINVRDYAVGERAVDVQIVGLRKKLGPAAKLIETVYGQGYRLRGP